MVAGRGRAGTQGIDCRGFHADTMHMARLWDSSRTMGKGYSLEALTGAAPPGFAATIVSTGVVNQLFR